MKLVEQNFMTRAAHLPNPAVQVHQFYLSSTSATFMYFTPAHHNFKECKVMIRFYHYDGIQW